MRVVIASICVGALLFLLRFLVALILDGRKSSGAATLYRTRLTLGGRTGELFVMPHDEGNWERIVAGDNRMAG